MGCCCSKPDKRIGYGKILRKETKETVDDEEHLPLGVLLTGGAKLRRAGLTGAGVKVAVIDSGVDAEHQGFLRGQGDQRRSRVTKKVWYRDGTPLSQDDHGTHVAGTIHLMAPDAEIYDYRVFGKKGRLGVTAAIAQAIRAATDVECDIINMSLGGPLPSPQIKAAVQYAASKGVVIVCAAGNEGDNNPLTNEVSYPAAFDECISVAAVSKKDGFPVARFSNSNAQVDYAGIGVDVVSFKPGGGVQNMSGTSMASPHVAGLIAALMSNGRIKPVKGDSKANYLRKILNESHAIDIAAEGRDNETGVGFLSYLDEREFDKLLPRKNLSAAKVM